MNPFNKRKKSAFRQRLDKAIEEAHQTIDDKAMADAWLKQYEATNSQKVEEFYEDKKTRPLSFAELHLILTRFQIMQDEEPDMYSIAKFIQQEDFRRNLFNTKIT